MASYSKRLVLGGLSLEELVDPSLAAKTKIKNALRDEYISQMFTVIFNF